MPTYTLVINNKDGKPLTLKRAAEYMQAFAELLGSEESVVFKGLSVNEEPIVLAELDEADENKVNQMVATHTSQFPDLECQVATYQQTSLPLD